MVTDDLTSHLRGRQTIFGDKTKAWNQGISYIRILLLISMTASKNRLSQLQLYIPTNQFIYLHTVDILSSLNGIF